MPFGRTLREKKPSTLSSDGPMLEVKRREQFRRSTKTNSKIQLQTESKAHLMVQASHPEHIGHLAPERSHPQSEHAASRPDWRQGFPARYAAERCKKNPIGYVLAEGQITFVRHIGLTGRVC